MIGNQAHLRRVLLAVIMLGVSFFLQIVGYSTPGWIFIKGEFGSEHLEYYIGLWYRITCYGNGTCDTEKVPVLGRSADGYSNEAIQLLLESQIETTLALVFCIAAFMSGLIYRNLRKGSVPSLLVICIFTAGISGVLALIPSGTYGHQTLKTHQEEKKVGLSLLQFPFSLFITGIGGVIACMVALFLMVEFHLYMKNNSQCKAGNYSVQMTGSVNSAYQESCSPNTNTFGIVIAPPNQKAPSTSSGSASPYAVGVASVSRPDRTLK